MILRLLRLAHPGLGGPGAGLTLTAGFGALVFAIHPLRVESVVRVSERGATC